MSKFISLVITTDGDIVFGNFRTHGGAAKAHGIAPGDYREADWIKDEVGERLTIRREPGEDPDHWLAMVRSLYPTWDDLFQSLDRGRTIRYDVPPDFVPTIEHYQLSRPKRRGNPIHIVGSLGTSYYIDMLGNLHNLRGPAMEYFGFRGWWFHGLRHRIGGPAIETPDGNDEWFEDGMVVLRGGQP